MSRGKWWSGDEVVNRICRSYSREDEQFISCPRCADIAHQHSCSTDGDTIRELRCTNCSHMERTVAVEMTEAGPKVNTLLFEADLSLSSATDEKLAAFLLWYDRSQEVAECR